MLILTRDEIEPLIDWTLAAEAVRAAYIAVSEGRVSLPPVGHITFPAGADCHIKYGHIADDPVFVIKVATGFPANARFGLPTGNGLSLVLSAQTGAVEAMLHDEMMLTDIRTGLGGAIASRAIARSDSRRILIVGTGVQARRQVQAHSALFGGDVVFTLWGRKTEMALAVVDELAQVAEISLADDLETACAQAEIIVTATGATKALIASRWVQPGTHITAVGADAPGKRELETALINRADRLFCDLLAQSLDHGEFEGVHRARLPNGGNITELGDVLRDPARGRKTDDEITIADLTGLAAQDIAIARVVLQAHESLRT